MRKYAATTSIIATLVMLTGSGCSQIQTVFRSPGSGAPANRPSATVRADHSASAKKQAPTIAPRARLARYQQPQSNTVKPNDAPKNQPSRTEPTKVDPKANRVDNVGTNGVAPGASKRTTDDESKQVAKARFTAPSPGFRQLGAITGLAVFATTTTGDQSARLASQSSVSVGGATIGGAGLAAPSPIVAGTIASSPGIVKAELSGFGPAGPNNIHTRQFNPASGPNGACNTLSQAGFTNVHAACQTQRGRR